MEFFGRSWCELRWTKWVRFSDCDLNTLPDQAGFYRIRAVGMKRLMYIGQTGSSLKGRLQALARETQREKMPYNDPHTGAPNLWAWRDASNLEYECAAAPARMSYRDRLARECYLLWQSRLIKGESPLCSLGRFHPCYKKSRGRSSGVRGRKLPRGKPNLAGERSAPPLQSRGNPADSNWMGLSWKQGGFKFQVQRVKDGAVAHRLPGASQSGDISSGACLGDARWRSTRAACSPTSPCPWASTGATARSCFHWCLAATGCTDRQRRSGSRAAGPTARARPSLSLGRRSRSSAAGWAHAGVS